MAAADRPRKLSWLLAEAVRVPGLGNALTPEQFWETGSNLLAARAGVADQIGLQARAATSEATATTRIEEALSIPRPTAHPLDSEGHGSHRRSRRTLRHP